MAPIAKCCPALLEMDSFFYTLRVTYLYLMHRDSRDYLKI